MFQLPSIMNLLRLHSLKIHLTFSHQLLLKKSLKKKTQSQKSKKKRRKLTKLLGHKKLKTVKKRKKNLILLLSAILTSTTSCLNYPMSYTMLTVSTMLHTWKRLELPVKL
uniref:S.cerevisiae (S288C) HSP26, SEC18, UBC4, tRNA-Arg and tRNA-Asp genes n=1 Tax=Saccharomyces cerevisiae TaxID=4932 RepID=E9PA41_YEASX|nr:unnamed protein product [Saccharomyces cerevisiae]